MLYCTVVSNIVDANSQNISRAVELLNDGKLIGMPTETVYGLAGDATRDDVVASIFAAKNRPNFNPLISHVTGLEMAMLYADFDEISIKLAEAIWNGPLTLVVPRKTLAKGKGICDLACAGLETAAIRAPVHPIAHELIKEFNKPIAAPSANVSGSISPTSARDVSIELGEKLAMILDGGMCEVGLESTVVGVFNGDVHLLRKGFYTAKDIERIIGKPVHIASVKEGNTPKSPGMLLRHYSPKSKVLLNSAIADEDEIFIAFGDIPAGVKGGFIQLSTTKDLTEAASNLYCALRSADIQNPKNIKVAPIPDTGMGEAINDRLTRAAGLA